MKHILIVDDNKENLTAARLVLNDTYKITAVTMGIQALKFLENNRADLILLDINMPEMDGFEVMNQIQSNKDLLDIPIVFLTADSDAKTESKCLECGALDYIAKPFVPAVMRSRISRILELEDLRKSLADRLQQKMQEVTEIKSKSQQDALTGLWNRSYTEDCIDKILDNGGTGAVFMIDMDNFKAVNDNYGHIAGDQVLKMFADSLRTFSSEGDVACRIGGDEFVLFIRNQTSKTDLSNKASDIISDICYKLEQCKYETNTSVSIGIAQFPEDGKTFKSLYNAADKALYYVKQNGKNSYYFYGEHSETENTRMSRTVDLNYLREIMTRTDSTKGAYMLDYDSFHHVYNFIRRFVERSSHDVQTILFTFSPSDKSEDSRDMEVAVDILEQAIFNSLRRVDVSTRYSSRQVIVILMDSNTDGGDLVAKRIIECFYKLYIGNYVSLDYDIVQMDKLV
ncbi:MAG TPA: diguanylate cyclase [Lachnospiraceae bacterium]|nr:diguanylate cyclase [Lachnospiraceae bacterium]